jgi:hypothetical protein
MYSKMVNIHYDQEEKTSINHVRNGTKDSDACYIRYDS